MSSICLSKMIFFNSLQMESGLSCAWQQNKGNIILSLINRCKTFSSGELDTARYPVLGGWEHPGCAPVAHRKGSGKYEGRREKHHLWGVYDRLVSCALSGHQC